MSKKILVMDDEEIVVDIASQMLMYLGYEVDIAHDGNEAIKLYNESCGSDDGYLAVIMDLNIPQGMGGLEAVKHVLAINDKAKIIVSSGYSTDPIVEDFKKYGFSGCISKPFDLKSLEEVLQKVL